MCLSVQQLLCFVFAAMAFVTVTASAQTDDGYAQQLREYDRRVAEQQAALDRQQQRQWLIPAVTIGAGVVLLVWSQRSTRQRAATLSEQSRLAVAEASEQNKRIIALLESIDRKTPGSGT